MNVTPAEQQVTAVLLTLWAQHTMTHGDLATTTGLSQEQIHVALHALAQRGCLVEMQPGSVELVRTGIACWRDILETRQRLRDGRFGRRVAVFRTTTSTNDICWTAADDPQADGLVVLADEQRRGRGRRGSSWAARPGQSVLMSVMLSGPAGGVESLTLLLGLACAEALEEATGRSLEIKWPNDVLLDGRKLAGVLVERRVVRGRETLVFGVGVNVAQGWADFPEPLRSRATSLYLATERQMDRLEVIERLLDRIESWCGRSVSQEWLEAWKRHCHMLGRQVQVRQAGGRTLRGRVLDVDPLQGLVLRDELGGTHFLSAQTSTIGENWPPASSDNSHK